ncbi:PIN domain-containing protein [Candidatus Acetothermia bacterium]|nr:PIN domain-containing protein [Candidatus Acetothermia bacterium]
MKLFIDIWGWLTLQDRKENRHREVKSLYEAARQQGSALYTTDYILNETFTLLFRRLSFPTARESLELFDRAITQGYLQLEQITPERFERAKRLRLKFQDKPKVSFTDFTSMVIMTELHIEEILTEDEHFLQVGMGFRRVP